jgi:hypothetical protein
METRGVGRDEVAAEQRQSGGEAAVETSGDAGGVDTAIAQIQRASHWKGRGRGTGTIPIVRDNVRGRRQGHDRVIEPMRECAPPVRAVELDAEWGSPSR